jgi:hypothetical protein
MKPLSSSPVAAVTDLDFEKEVLQSDLPVLDDLGAMLASLLSASMQLSDPGVVIDRDRTALVLTDRQNDPFPPKRPQPVHIEKE